MLTEKKKLKLLATLGAAAILLTGLGLFAFNKFYFQPFSFRPPNAQKMELGYNTITPEDLKPLPVPEQSTLRQRAIKVPILMYHHIGNLPLIASATRKDLTVDPKDFETQVKWLKDQGYSSVNLKQLYLLGQNQNKSNWPQKPVIFTFDDGYADVFENAVPILLKYGFTGSFAIITQMPGTAGGNNFYASWQQIAQAQTLGMEILCHTQNHFDGKDPKFSANYIFNNLSGCVADIANHLGSKTQILVYPYGHYNLPYIAQAKKAGFVMGVTVHEGNIINLDDLMEIPRVRVHRHENLELFKRLVSE